MDISQTKIRFSGRILSVQPRSNVWRYRLDNRSHSLTGYNIFIAGTADGNEMSFSVAISEKQQQKYRFHIDDVISGTAWTKKYAELEYADYYRAGALKKEFTAPVVSDETGKAPWVSEVPDLSVYDWRGCRMLDKKCWSRKCFQCKWAAMANVAIEYEWGVRQKFRFETFCYGPKNCKLWKMGRARAVSYKGMGTDYDTGWLDDICTQNRNDEE